jgi:hypothetical protein
MAESTIAGAYSVSPAERPRWHRKMALASARVLESKRCSRYSYAVKTLARWKTGTTVAHRITIAMGRPK